jgi:asparagine synthase (glutamine-hydrolysing)
MDTAGPTMFCSMCRVASFVTADHSALSAISAYLATDARPDLAGRIAKQSAPLVPYGGDRQASWLSPDRRVALAIEQKFRTDEDYHDGQPTLRDGVVVVADARLDDRETLTRRLGVRNTGTADSSLIASAWLHWGPECLRHLVGDFAFIVWDARAHRLFAAVDFGGARPLFYTFVRGDVAIASMPKGLLALPEVNRSLDELFLTEELLRPLDLPSRSAYSGILRLGPGHSMTIVEGGGHPRIDRFWNPPEPGSIRLPTDEAYVDRLLELYSAAVDDQLRSVGQIATTLSAGLDSGSVTALAARRLAARGQRLFAVTQSPKPSEALRKEGRFEDEYPRAALLAASAGNIDHARVETADVDLLSLLPALEHASDAPVLNPSALMLYLALRQARGERAFTVLLTGLGGNASISFNGDVGLSALLRNGSLARWATEASMLARQPGRSRGNVVRASIAPILPQPLLRLWSRARGRGPRLGRAWTLLRHDFRRRPEVAELGKRATRHTLPLDRAQDVRAFTVRPRMMTLWIGMETLLGCDIRDPTADRRVVEFCFGIPFDQFLRGGSTRWLIRRAARGLIPDALIDEPLRGTASADWPRYIAPYLASFTEEIDRLERSPMASAMFDIGEMRRMVVEAPARFDWVHLVDYYIGLFQCLGVGGFIRRFEEGEQPEGSLA